MKAKYHVVIVGSGIGGLSAARTLSGHGLDILLIDENAHLGGQLLRKSEKPRKSGFDIPFGSVRSKGGVLIQHIRDACPDIDRIHQAQVLGIFKDRRLLVHTRTGSRPDKTGTTGKKPVRLVEVRAEHLILATGARERYLPFKGWDLPGVMSLGAAQILMKSHGVLPAFSTVIAGTSPLMMVLASEILKNKGKVAAVLDENSFIKKAGFLPLIRHHWQKPAEGIFYTARMMRSRVPMNHQIRIVEARGSQCLESVVAAKTALDGRVITGTEIEYPTRALAIGYGFVPNIELAVQAGCDIDYCNRLGGWVVRVGRNLESSVSSVYAVGETTGIAGAGKSCIQGEMAALSILKRLNKLNLKKDRASFQIRMDRLYSLNRQQEMYGAFLTHLCGVPAAAYRQIADDTLICRCENVTMGTIRKAIEQGFTTSGGLKKATRSGMGRCQGRICGAVITEIILALTGKEPGDIGPSLSRAPVKNVPVRSFLTPCLTD